MGTSTVVSLLTPPGRGAVATLMVQGPQATAAVASRFRSSAAKPLDSFPPDRIAVGWWQHGSGTREEVVVFRRGAEEVEVHCHGGHAAADAILGQLVQAGCRQVPWQEWLRQQSLGPLAAEAAITLSKARTERTAAILLDQQRGALEAAIRDLLAQIDAADISAAEAGLLRLRSATRLGEHLASPWRVVLAGQPNVGKSRLINAILGYRRAIVFDQPGTTRDVLTAHTAIDGWPVELADTAGLRTTGDPLESAGAESARQRIAAADLVVLVFDLSRRWTADDDQLFGEFPQGLVVHTKSDLAEATDEHRPAGIRTSAVSGRGLDDLLTAIAARLVPDPPPPGAPVPFTERQCVWLRRAAEALAGGNAAEAAGSLRALLAQS